MLSCPINSGATLIEAIAITAPKIFPAFYQTTYHARDYVESHWSRFFQILDYVGLGDQDLVIMQR